MQSYLLGFLGGLLLGISTIGYLYTAGRVAGVSGLLSQTLKINSWFKSTAFWFIAGLILMPLCLQIFIDIPVQINTPPSLLVVSGILVGIGTRLGSGCTSGHGICGLSRLSKRSMVAVICFMLSALLTVQLKHISNI
ncbi:YeeE/YedE family protein [Acinetobacter qingfengensis]|uniref:Uncharacterized protein n=1 Tax=Acinetobacter qingfengensis TaxID=1262585 RepID=A0A1E7RC82_9GAMM|nr:YeeE/YedE thiosulfate transporter family protein [Acinetobacter qingfengensis]KAA8734844.1 YeeE/YedE family protein [Acinetobacter qingfengensis]OEY96886.1 hypothetical protein BJI46_11905 [Acinetobacter qingfengensis]